MRLLRLLLLALLLIAAVWEPEHDLTFNLSPAFYEAQQDLWMPLSDDIATDDPNQPQGYFDRSTL